MSSMLVCNDCQQDADQNYTEHWVTVTIMWAGIEFVAHYCPLCWTKEFARKLAPVVGEIGEEADGDTDANS